MKTCNIYKGTRVKQLKNNKKKILVLADSHNRKASLYDIVKLHKDASYIIHLGDYVRDAEVIEKQLNVNIIKIKANGDFSTNMPLKKFQELIN